MPRNGSKRLFECECCRDPFDQLRSNVAKMSELTAGSKEWSSGSPEFDSLLREIKSNGREMLVAFQRAFVSGEVPKMNGAFAQSVSSFGAAVDRLALSSSSTSVEAKVLARLREMKLALEGMVRSSQLLVNELEAEGCNTLRCS